MLSSAEISTGEMRMLLASLQSNAIAPERANGGFKIG